MVILIYRSDLNIKWNTELAPWFIIQDSASDIFPASATLKYCVIRIQSNV